MDSTVASDVALLRRVAAQDAAAVGELYDRYSRLLFGIIVRILRNQSDAEETLQEVFVRVWTHAETYDERLGRPGAWLVRIARNRAIDRLRAARRAGVEVPEPSFRPPVVEMNESVRGALASLPDEQRTLIEAAFWDGYTHSELAERFGLPLGTVKTRIRTGMIAMRERLEQPV